MCRDFISPITIIKMVARSRRVLAKLTLLYCIAYVVGFSFDHGIEKQDHHHFNLNKISEVEKTHGFSNKFLLRGSTDHFNVPKSLLNENEFNQVQDCPPGTFGCQNSRCIALSSLCDGTDDCGDGSDEASCGRRLRRSDDFKADCGSNTCTAIRFRCNDRRWINRLRICDGERDCADGSDEENCLQRECYPTKFKCANTGICIWMMRRCNGENDCSDGSDEAGCELGKKLLDCGSNMCTEDRFRCTNGLWIERNHMCDGSKHCDDGSDENDCAHRDCLNRFKCANTSLCIDPSLECDSEDNCADGSDEANCAPQDLPDTFNSTECGSNKCTEDRFQCTNGRWIFRKYACDGVKDCADGSDENDCAHRSCPSAMFRCADTGLCLPLSKRCDNDDDCSDGSDEEGCHPLVPECGSNNCTVGRFQCTSGRWINRSKMCNSYTDCNDRSDENDCIHKQCLPNTFKCANTGLCIKLSWRCDGTDDCHDGSDEAGCP